MKIKKLSVAILLLSSATYLTACGPLLVGGAAAGATYVAKDERTVGTIVDDATITTEIKAKFIKDHLIHALDIHINTEKGVVTLKGSVPNHEVVKRALTLTKNTKGVIRIINHLKIAH
ncbi:MAG: BON domain-containing protein [Alphaproteobacteria bacterium]